MEYYISYTKDAVGNNYLAINIERPIVEPYLEELESIIGDEYETFTNLQQERDHNKHHITVINVMEYNRLCKEIGMSKFITSLDDFMKYPITDLELLGIGTASKNTNTTYFVVCKSDKLKAIRDNYGLPNQDFHITLGFKNKDVFGVRKNVVLGKI